MIIIHFLYSYKHYLVNEEKLAQQETITKSGYFEKSILLKDAMETVKLFEQNTRIWFLIDISTTYFCTTNIY